MPSLQRRRGQPATVYPYKTIVDGRGQRVRVADTDNPIQVVAAFVPERSARAELAGQQQIQIVKMIVRHDIENFELWARVRWDGSDWDVVTPPAYHHGTRHTRHVTASLRRRPLPPPAP